jgi:hypothetical protein
MTIWRENCASRFEAKEVVNDVRDKGLHGEFIPDGTTVPEQGMLVAARSAPSNLETQQNVS